MAAVELTPLEQGELYGYIVELKRILDRAAHGHAVDFGYVPRIVSKVCRFDVTLTGAQQNELRTVIATLEHLLSESAEGRSVPVDRIRIVSEVC
jgi:hypothetical protein